MEKSGNKTIPAIKVSQWLRGWDQVAFSDGEHRKKPEPHFYLFSLPASEMRSLCGISRRSSTNLRARSADLGIQREHDRERSSEIGRFVEFGYPWSTISEAKRKSTEFNDLRKPGWLPTAIVINILPEGVSRNGIEIAPADAVVVQPGDAISSLILPYKEWSQKWKPKSIPPFEVIDGQHRLWAFDDEVDDSFELPVVAFYGLDISWQAYLFWTINIKPKRINPSLAFDLYPLLRGEDWLDRAEGHPIYRETRAQELTEALWVHPESPWFDRINMLGERQTDGVTQAAWIRSLMTTFVKPWQGRGNTKIGGLFGSRMQNDNEVLGWSRAQQAAFLIHAWSELYKAVINSSSSWAKNISAIAIRDDKLTSSASMEERFYGKYSLISTDQGVRGYLHVLNDVCYSLAPKLDLRSWKSDSNGSASDIDAVTAALKTYRKHDSSKTISVLAESLSSFDWRTSSTPDLEADVKRRKLVFRGGSGYKEIRLQLLEHLTSVGGDVGSAAARVQKEVI
ncbi:DGQHR domain-containing protein [Brucella anthropi]|uniref:DGQHR domain-containing protein n=1 Tax=Brucella anthropi TaxID=529 RepID=UPI00178C659B|nr:DGQHR domain-containing protein [Brucella anthropi]